MHLRLFLTLPIIPHPIKTQTVFIPRCNIVTKTPVTSVCAVVGALPMADRGWSYRLGTELLRGYLNLVSDYALDTLLIRHLEFGR